ncbi:hypothetical protein [Streptomyces sp. cg36]|uniref:hypothetical protein n=1 Tax=Streptomyces sp. cg36 TaxID=3238798 RepID=UPI0034E2D9BE
MATTATAPIAPSAPEEADRVDTVPAYIPTIEETVKASGGHMQAAEDPTPNIVS